jgi:hypothetical protein
MFRPIWTLSCVKEDLGFSRWWLWRMASSEMLRRVPLVRTDVSEELSASFIRVTRIFELGTTLAETSNRSSVLTRATRRNIPEDAILHVLMILWCGNSCTFFMLVRVPSMPWSICKRFAYLIWVLLNMDIHFVPKYNDMNKQVYLTGRIT